MLCVNYFYSTSIWRIGTFVRMGAQTKENKGVELTGGGGNSGQWERARVGGEFQAGKISITRCGVCSSCLKIRITDRWRSQNPRRRLGARSTRRIGAAPPQSHN